MMKVRCALAVSIFIFLSACGDDEAEAVGGVSEGEAKALNEAAEVLDSRMPPPVIDENATQALRAAPH